MRLQSGAPTLIETAGLEDCARLCASLGLDFIELNMNLPQYQLGRMDVSHFRSLSEKYGIGYTIHLDENLNPFDFNPYVAQAYLRTTLDTVALAKELHAPILNMHLSKGVYFTLPDRKVYLFEQYRGEYLDRVRGFREACTRAIGSAPVRICVENCDGYTGFQKEAIEVLLESPVFGLTFDIGHDHGIGGIDEPFILAHGDRLRHMHIHDASGRKNHLPLGGGEIDIPKYLALARQHDCRVVLETKTVEGLTQSVRWFQDHNG